MENLITINTDGAARGNPGPASIAFVIRGCGELVEQAAPIGSTTNNQAEYRAMRSAMTKLTELAPQNSQIVVNSDSELMIRQLTGVYRVKDANIKPIYDEIVSLLDRLRRAGNIISLQAVRREQNKRADELANLALDGKLGLDAQVSPSTD